MEPVENLPRMNCECYEIDTGHLLRIDMIDRIDKIVKIEKIEKTLNTFSDFAGQVRRSASPVQ